jgi:hypothetical protein
LISVFLPSAAYGSPPNLRPPPHTWTLLPLRLVSRFAVSAMPSYVQSSVGTGRPERSNTVLL